MHMQIDNEGTFVQPVVNAGIATYTLHCRNLSENKAALLESLL